MAEDTMFQEAVEALRRGDKARAKEQLTLLLKAEQTNPIYWIWMSAAVDTAKERLYCLQTALKLDPENATAKRGLIMLGALPPDENIQPFSLNRPRAWEQKLLLAHELPRPKGIRAITSNPAARLAGVVVLGVVVCAAVVFGFMLPRSTLIALGPSNTPGPSPTFTATPTFLNATAQPSPTFIGPTPLWMFLPATYTPTPLYVNTPRAPQSSDQFRAARTAYEQGNWDEFITGMELISTLEPDAADIYYYIGEAYRMKGDAGNAIEACNHALEIDPDFGPPYLCLARARLLQEPNANVETLLDFAVERDPNFGEVYLERARYFLSRNDPEAALVDLDRANDRLPDSPEVYLTYAQAYMALEDLEQALEAAEKANELDQTSLPSYLLLGELYVADGQYQEAIEALVIYTNYEREDSRALAMIGQSYFELEEYDLVVQYLDAAFQLNPSGLRRYSAYRGLAHLELGNADQAVTDLERAFAVDDENFDINLGLARAYYLQEKFGNAFLRIESMESLAETDEQTALIHYWRALIQEERGQAEDAIAEWEALLDMDEDAMTTEMRAEAEEHLRTIVTPTNTPRPVTRTVTPTRPTRTVTPTRTRTPTP
jgi:tetratricopeptide (TPR) repeat protein